MRRREISTDTGEEPVPQFIGGYSVLARLSNHKATAVFRAYDKARQRDVCIKRLTEVGAKSASSILAMQREVDLGRRLQHEGLVAHFGYETNLPRHYFVMEYFAPGTTLTQTHVQRDCPFPTPPLKPVLLRILDALAFVHNHGVIHRDIKPDNVLVNDAGHVRVIDFSVAFEIGRKLPAWKRWLGLKHKVVGTRTYMAPEQIEGRDVDGRADLYSFGVMLFELLAGRAPFTADNPDALLRQHLNQSAPTLNLVNPAVTAEVSSLVARLLAKPQKLRPTKCEDVIHVLSRNKLLQTDAE